MLTTTPSIQTHGITKLEPSHHHARAYIILRPITRPTRCSRSAAHPSSHTPPPKEQLLRWQRHNEGEPGHRLSRGKCGYRGAAQLNDAQGPLLGPDAYSRGHGRLARLPPLGRARTHPARLCHTDLVRQARRAV